jgi:hypothetical protein
MNQITDTKDEFVYETYCGQDAWHSRQSNDDNDNFMTNGQVNLQKGAQGQTKSNHEVT